jgi:hypothetical protein
VVCLLRRSEWERAECIFPQKFPVIGVFSLLIDFLGSAFGPGLAGERRNSGIFGQFPVKLTGNFCARNREFGFVEQGIRFHGTGNSKRSQHYERLRLTTVADPTARGWAFTFAL